MRQQHEPEVARCLRAEELMAEKEDEIARDQHVAPVRGEEIGAQRRVDDLVQVVEIVAEEVVAQDRVEDERTQPDWQREPGAHRRECTRSRAVVMTRTMLRRISSLAT